jgi:importin subunit beta-1
MEKDVKKLFGYVIKSFDDRKGIYDEGISLIGNIAIYLQRGFINEMDTFNKYLLHGLNSTNSLDICKTSLITLSEIITNCENDFNIYVNDYMNLILKILSDNTIVRDLKPRCLQIISDLLVNCRQEVFKYFDEIMKMIGGAIQVCQMDFRAEMDTIDFINYMVELKEAVLETLGCIFNAVIEEEKTNDFIPYAKGVVEFINLILREEGQLNFDIIRNSIGIIADYCRVYGKNIKPILNSGLLKDCIEKFKKSEECNSNEQMKAFIIWAQNCITEVLLSN